MADTYTTVLYKMDDAFDPEDTTQYGLAIAVGDSGLSWCINDLKRGKYLGLHHVERKDKIQVTGSLSEKTSLVDFMNELISDFPHLKNQYKLLKIAFEGCKSTLIPASVFDPSEVANYMEFSFGEGVDDHIFSDHLVSPDAYQVFAMPSEYARVLSEQFDRHRIINTSSVFIEGIWMNYKSRSRSPKIFLNIRSKFMDLMVFDGSQMTYFNTFSQHNRDDIVYYLIFVMEQLNHDPEHIPLILFGNAGEDEALMDLLMIYIRNIELGKRSAFFKYSHVLREVPAHSHYPLFNLLSCGL
jgi:hypothetical protein